MKKNYYGIVGKERHSGAWAPFIDLFPTSDKRDVEFSWLGKLGYSGLKKVKCIVTEEKNEKIPNNLR